MDIPYCRPAGGLKVQPFVYALPCYLVSSSRGRLVIPTTIFLQASRSLVKPHSSVSVYVHIATLFLDTKHSLLVWNVVNADSFMPRDASPACATIISEATCYGWWNALDATHSHNACTIVATVLCCTVRTIVFSDWLCCGLIISGRPWRYSVIPSSLDFPTEYQIRRNSYPAGLPVFAAISGPDFRASIIIDQHV